jgi:uncharacterized protein (DUF1800 family)
MQHKSSSSATTALLRYLMWVAGAVLAFTLIVNEVRAQSSPVMSFDEARHLLNRTSFAAQPKEIAAFSKLTRSEAVDRLLAETRRHATFPAPEWSQRYERFYNKDMTQEQRQEARKRELVTRGLELRSWWTAEMLSTPSPFTEKMTLFWHNHFSTSQQKVNVAELMFRQNALLRKHALGNFAVMLRDVAKDPAMLIYLDGAQNRKGAPNENFAREVMELFTLGQGNYTEQDIKEVARALTGWGADMEVGEFRFRRPQHDDGMKTIFGQTGRFSGDDVITMLLKRDETAEFIVGKLWLEFVSPEPNTATVKRIAAVWRDASYEIKPMLRALLLADEFWNQKHRAVLVKSPVELVIGSLRQFQFEVEDPAPFAVIMRQLGQDLFGPPNVKGWPGGEAWLNTTTLLARKGFLNRLFRADEMGQPATAATLIDRDLMGQRRDKAQARLATVNARTAQRTSVTNDMGAMTMSASTDSMGTSNAMASGMPAFGVNNNLKGQYYFNSAKWLGQYPNQSDADMLWKTLLAGPPVQATQLKYDLAGLRAIALDPMYQLK